MKKLALLLSLLCALNVQAQTYWDGTADKNFPGEGTEASPYLISTPEQLAGLAERTNVDKEDFAGKYIKLTADIYLTNFDDPDQENWKEWEPIGHHYWTNGPGAARDTCFFRGHFDGDGHTVYSMYYGGGLDWGSDITLDPIEWMEEWMSGNDPKDLDDLDFTPWFRGLFGFVKGSVENVTVADARLSGVNVAPVVVWVGKNASVSNCHARNNMILTTEGVPSFFVCDNLGLIENCSSQGEGASPAAGLVVTNAASGVIRGCSVDVVSTGGWFGGVTYTNEGLIEQTAAQVDITTDGYANGGGFTYTNGGTIRECYSTGSVKGKEVISSGGRGWLTGKIAGFCVMNTGYIESCYSTCDMTDLSTQPYYDGHVDMAGFVITNGIEPQNQDDRPIPGYCVNCFSTGSLNYTAYNDRLSVCPFLRLYAGARVNAMAAYGEPARQIGCYWNQDGVPSVSDKKNHEWAGEPVTLAYMKSEAFVNDLNKMAYFTGTSQWEYRAGQLPVATGVRTKDHTKCFSQGDGTKANPFQVGTKTELENLAWLTNHGYDFRNEYLKQTADIALNAPQSEWGETAPTKWQSIGIDHTSPYYETVNSDWFRGNYDGGFHEVQNMYINSSLAWQGLFGHIGGQFAKRGGQYGESDAWIEPTTIRNLGVTDVFIRSAIAGAVVGDIGYWSNIIQCWSSGKIYSVAATDQCIAGLGGKIDSHTNILNCQTSVELIPANQSAKSYSFIGEFYSMICDTIANALYTGVINGTQQIDLGFAFTNFGGSAENVFRDITVSKYEYVDKDRQLYTTEQMQSKELVNRLNAYVTSWNSKHGADMQLDYWEWREGNYPRVNPEIISSLATVEFQSNGGSETLPITVVPESQIEAPARPTKSGYVFAAWYRDEACTEFFDFKRDEVTEDMTLYAKWLVDDRNDIDMTPFQNEFATTYHIKTAAQLRGLVAAIAGLYDYNNRADLPPTIVMNPMDISDKTVVLDNDIFLNDTTDWRHWGNHCYAVPWTPIGYGPYGVDNGALQFTGTFDGQGHTIYGMYIEMNAQMEDMGWCNAHGLFSRVNGGTIRNVGIDASVIDLRNHKDTPSPTAGYVYSSGIASGMLVGRLNGEKIEQSYARGKIIPEELREDGIEMYDYQLGGLVGELYISAADMVTDCYARVDIIREKNGDTKGFGLCGSGKAQTSFTNCYSSGITQQGNNQAGTYYNNVLVAMPSTETSAKTTAEMKQKTTYEGWDFDTVWGISSILNDGYPFLRQFHPDAPSITIIAKSYTREYGEANPTFEFTSEGEELVGTPVITCEATATSPVGEYPIVISKGSVTNDNETFVNGVLKITKAPLTIAAKSYSIKQGKDLPQYELEYSGFKNNETKNALSKQPTVTCEASAFSLPGVYDILVSGAEATNYEISYEKGTLTITPFKKGDVNNDGYVDVADLTGVVHFILNESTANLVFDSADMDESGAVEINDYAALVKLILNSPKTNASMARRSPANLEDLISLSSNEGGEIFVSLLENRQFTGLQFDLVLPEGVTLAENGTRSESPQHGCWSARHEDGEYRILCSSMSNAELNEGLILRLKTNGHNGGGVSVSNVVLSDIYSSRHEAASAETLLNNTTAIAQVTGDDLTIRTAKGTLSLLSNRDQTVIIYGANGIKISEVKLSAGQANSIKLPSGVYVINNKKAAVQ
jgi:uncharacterized repeat protein (TIGR02543 family)